MQAAGHGRQLMNSDPRRRAAHYRKVTREKSIRRGVLHGMYFMELSKQTGPAESGAFKAYPKAGAMGYTVFKTATNKSLRGMAVQMRGDVITGLEAWV